MKTLKIIPFILLCFAFCGNSANGQNPAAPDGEYQSITKTYTLNPAGDWTFRYQQRLKFLTYFAIHNLYGETFIVYNPGFQKLKINKAVTTMADGTLVTAPANAFNEVLPKYATNFPTSNMLREMVVTHTGLERGAITELDYALTTAAGFYPAMMGNEVLQTSSPTKELTIIIKISESSTLQYKLVSAESAPVITKENGMQVYTFSFKNLAATTHDDFQARDQRFLPRLIFSSGKGFNTQLTNMLSRPAFTYSISGKLKSYCDLLVKNYPDAFARLMKIQDVVVNELNYFPVPPATMGFRFRTANETWSSNGGTETEKAILMSAMLKGCGFDARAVAVVPAAYYDPANANLIAIEKVVVEVSGAGISKMLISPLQNDVRDLKFSLAGKKRIPLAGKTFAAQEVSMFKNELSLNTELILDSHGRFSGEAGLIAGGALNPAFKIRSDKTYKLKMLSGAFGTADISSGELKKTDDETTEATYTILTIDSLKQQAGYSFWKLPALSSGTDGWHIAELASKRNTPLELPMLISESYTFKVTLPEGMTLVTPKTDLVLNPDKVGRMSILISQQGNELRVTRTLQLNDLVIQPENYEAFRNLINIWSEKRYKEMVFKK